MQEWKGGRARCAGGISKGSAGGASVGVDCVQAGTFSESLIQKVRLGP